MSIANYNKNIFLNCPFDKKYKPIFDAVIFTALDCGYMPRCALEIQDSSEDRLKKIIKIIHECQFAIHDISCTTLDKINKLPRFNMPFELGLFMGAKYFGGEQHKTKNCLILEKETYGFQKFISDIAGHDIKAHKNNFKITIHLIRDWLNHSNSKEQIPGSAHIQYRYKEFQQKIPSLCNKLKLSLNNVGFKDYCNIVALWLSI